MQSEWEGWGVRSSRVRNPAARACDGRHFSPEHILIPMRWTLWAPLPCPGKWCMVWWDYHEEQSKEGLAGEGGAVRQTPRHAFLEEGHLQGGCSFSCSFSPWVASGAHPHDFLPNRS